MNKPYSTRVKADLRKSTGANTQNDAETLNLSRRAFNVRTLNSASKMGELIALATLHNIAVTALQEHRKVQEDIEVK